MEETFTDFGKRLDALMVALDLDRTQMADIMGCTPQAVGNYLGGREPKRQYLDALEAKKPRVNIKWLIEGVGTMFKDGEAPAQAHEPAAEYSTKGLLERLRACMAEKKQLEAHVKTLSKTNDHLIGQVEFLQTQLQKTH